MSIFTELLVNTFPGLVVGPHDSKTSAVRITTSLRDVSGRLYDRRVVARLRAGETYHLMQDTDRVVEVHEELIEKPANNFDLV